MKSLPKKIYFFLVYRFFILRFEVVLILAKKIPSNLKDEVLVYFLCSPLSNTSYQD